MLKFSKNTFKIAAGTVNAIVVEYYFTVFLGLVFAVWGWGRTMGRI